jgi:hypothetical protein
MHVEVPFIVAGSLGLLGAAIHGGVGERLVVQKISRDTLPSSPFGGPSFTKVMIRVTWHLVTITFATLGVALILMGTRSPDSASRAIGVVAASAFTAFFLLAAVVGFRPRVIKASMRHPAPLMFALSAALCWWGAFAT